jgi:small subunit ribosomal protein S6
MLKNKYELALVLSPVISDEIYNQELNKIKELVYKFNGEILNIDEWGKKKLAYAIKNYREGIYCFIKFEAQVDLPKEIESRLRIKENFLRFLIIKEKSHKNIKARPKKINSFLEEEGEVNNLDESLENSEEIAESQEEVIENREESLVLNQES